MTVVQIVLISLVSIYCLGYLYYLIKSQKPLRTFLLMALYSLMLYAIVNLTAFATGIYLPVNLYTVIGTATGGVPVFLAFLGLRYIFVL